MTTGQFIGWCMVVALFAALFIAAGHEIGWRPMLGVILATAALVAWLRLATYLIGG